MDPMDTYDDTDLETVASRPDEKMVLDMNAMTAYYFKVRRPMHQYSEEIVQDEHSITADSSRELQMSSELNEMLCDREEIQFSGREHTPEPSTSDDAMTVDILQEDMNDPDIEENIPKNNEIEASPSADSSETQEVLNDPGNEVDIPKNNEVEESSTADSSESSSDEEVVPDERQARFPIRFNCGVTAYGGGRDRAIVYRDTRCLGANYRGAEQREANFRGSASNSGEISMLVVFHKPPADK